MRLGSQCQIQYFFNFPPLSPFNPPFIWCKHSNPYFIQNPSSPSIKIEKKTTTNKQAADFEIIFKNKEEALGVIFQSLQSLNLAEFFYRPFGPFKTKHHYDKQAADFEIIFFFKKKRRSFRFYIKPLQSGNST